jgi:hypothetical protein
MTKATADLATAWFARPADDRGYYENNIVNTIGETAAMAAGWRSANPSQAMAWAAECEEAARQVEASE